MFSQRPLGDHVERVRDAHAPGAVVVEADSDFETLPPAQAEELGLLVESVEPATYPAEWVPPDAPEVLSRYAGGEFTVGMPGDGGVAWTVQTDPPVVVVKPRLAGSPEEFVDFLIAEALVQVGLGEPEQFLGFFGERYPAFHDAATGYLDAASAYQVAAACYDAYLGLQTRDVFADWDGEQPELFAAWLDAGERLRPRLSDLGSELARGRTSFGDAAELACSAVKHVVEPGSTGSHSQARQDAVEIPAPFDALDAEHYREHGADYALRWAERTFAALE
jgi:hypothetical protein